MKKEKTEFKLFNILQWEKEQDYLREQHRKGWKFVRLNFIGLYHFEKCSPEDVVYQLDYNSEGIAHKDEYVQMFSDCGWEYLQDFAGYSYFRKPTSKMDGRDEEIFCDDASRLDMMKRVFQGRMIPLFVIFFLLILPNLFMQLQNDTAEGQILLIIFSILFIIYIALFIGFGIQFSKYQKSVNQ